MQTEITERDHLREQAALLSHELRNPLTVILGNANYLLRENVTSGGSEPLADIREGAERALAIINTFLQPDEDTSEPVSLQAACHLVCREFKHSGPDRPINLFFEDALLPARASQVQVEEVIQNLVSNADKYSPAGLPITISVTRDAQSLVVSVSDAGSGIPLNEQENIFHWWYRMDQHHDQAGSGLGLIICRRLVEGWSGRIWYEARPAAGATFCFTVPVWTAEDRA